MIPSTTSDQPTTEKNLSTLLSRAAREPEPFKIVTGTSPEWVNNIARAKQDGTFDKVRDDFNYTYANAKYRRWMDEAGRVIEYNGPDEWAMFAMDLAKKSGGRFDPVLGFQLADQRTGSPGGPTFKPMSIRNDPNASEERGISGRTDAQLASQTGSMRSDSAPVRRAAPRQQTGMPGAGGAAVALDAVASDQPMTLADALAKSKANRAAARALGRGPAPINPMDEENAAREDAIRMLTAGGKTRPSPIRRAAPAQAPASPAIPARPAAIGLRPGAGMMRAY